MVLSPEHLGTVPYCTICNEIVVLCERLFGTPLGAVQWCLLSLQRPLISRHVHMVFASKAVFFVRMGGCVRIMSQIFG